MDEKTNAKKELAEAPKPTQRTEKIRIFSIIYTVISVIALVVLTALIVIIEMANKGIQPQFVNYGDGTVSGWATILSLIGASAGWLGKLAAAFVVIICVMMVAYWAIELLLSCLLRKSVKRGSSSKGLGILTGIWTMIPGLAVAGALFSGGASVLSWLLAVISFGGGIFLLVTVLSKDAAASWLPLDAYACHPLLFRVKYAQG